MYAIWFLLIFFPLGFKGVFGGISLQYFFSIFPTGFFLGGDFKIAIYR
jgi:hypothetical protein